MAQDGLIHFYGVVKNEDNVALYGATVMLFACLPEGVEEPLANTLTDENGQYYLTTRRLNNFAEVQGFRVRACFEGTIPKGTPLLVQPAEQPEQQEHREQTEPDKHEEPDIPDEQEEPDKQAEPDEQEDQTKPEEPTKYDEPVEQTYVVQEEESWTPPIFDQISTPEIYNPINNIFGDSVAYVRDGQIWLKVFGRV